MKELDPNLTQAVIAQNKNRTSWQEHDTAQNVASFLIDESQELDQAVEEAMIGGSAFCVASEVGDVIYLYTKLVSLCEKEPTVYRAYYEYALYICELCGIDPNDALKLKLLRNSYKYPDYLHNNGLSWQEATQTSKDVWKQLGGDSVFSQMYEQLSEQL